MQFNGRDFTVEDVAQAPLPTPAPQMQRLTLQGVPDEHFLTVTTTSSLSATGGISACRWSLIDRISMVRRHEIHSV